MYVYFSLATQWSLIRHKMGGHLVYLAAFLLMFVRPYFGFRSDGLVFKITQNSGKATTFWRPAKTSFRFKILDKLKFRQ